MASGLRVIVCRPPPGETKLIVPSRSHVNAKIPQVRRFLSMPNIRRLVSKFVILSEDAELMSCYWTAAAAPFEIPTSFLVFWMIITRIEYAGPGKAGKTDGE